MTQDPVVVQDKELLQTCMILLGYLQKDETKNTAAITEIKEVCIINIHYIHTYVYNKVNSYVLLLSEIHYM